MTTSNDRSRTSSDRQHNYLVLVGCITISKINIKLIKIRMNFVREKPVWHSVTRSSNITSKTCFKIFFITISFHPLIFSDQ